MGTPARPGFCSPAGAPAALDRLRRELCAAEAAAGLAPAGGAALALGIPAIDGVLGGGLSCGALHEIAAMHETETAAATGFALALAARQGFPSWRGASRAEERGGSTGIAGRNVLWIAEDLSLAENGAPYGPGLDGAGIAPERLITVTAARGRDVLWAMEEALRCRAVGVVIGEMRSRRYRSGDDAAARARGRGRRHARPASAHRAARRAFRRRDALDHRRGALLMRSRRRR